MKKAKVIVYRFKCPYNDKKTWIIKRYPCGHYYLNQMICGRLFNKRFVRISKWYIENILDLKLDLPFDPPYTITD